jgi:hypothetical protein
MRFILFTLLVTGCSRTETQVIPPTTPTTAITTFAAPATCGIEEPAAMEIIEVKKPVKKSVFDRDVCR